MENKSANQGAESTGAEAVATQDTASAVDNASPSESTFEEGGELKAGGDYSLVYYLTFALLLSASAYEEPFGLLNSHPVSGVYHGRSISIRVDPKMFMKIMHTGL